MGIKSNIRDFSDLEKNTKLQESDLYFFMEQDGYRRFYDRTQSRYKVGILMPIENQQIKSIKLTQGVLKYIKSDYSEDKDIVYRKSTGINFKNRLRWLEANNNPQLFNNMEPVRDYLELSENELVSRIEDLIEEQGLKPQKIISLQAIIPVYRVVANNAHI